MANNAYHDHQNFDAILHFWARERADSPAFDQDEGGDWQFYAPMDCMLVALIG